VTVLTTAMIPCGIAAGQAGAGFATASGTLATITALGGLTVVFAGIAMVLGARSLTVEPAVGATGTVNAD
jgi:hypothetical protein